MEKKFVTGGRVYLFRGEIIKEEGEERPRFVPSFNVSEKDFSDVKFPVYCQVTGSYSDYFGWSSWDTYNLYSSEGEGEYEQRYHGNVVEGFWAENAKELIKALSSYENEPYYQGSPSGEYERVGGVILDPFSYKKVAEIFWEFEGGGDFPDQTKGEYCDFVSALLKG